ncbi:MAG: hypothetical protein P1V20_15435 [Verrucomicrobiales bacterium]|nr:hypothetical protein [Verrucomicrobiales bacterium]
MNCPDCGKDMEYYTVGLKKSVLNFLLFGFGSRSLYLFKGARPEQKIITPHERIASFRRHSCRTIVMKPSV